MDIKLSSNEYEALRLLRDKGSLLLYEVSDKNELDVHGWVVPGLNVFKKLVKKGLVVITEEETTVFDDGDTFEFTPTIELTEEGSKFVKEMKW